MKEPERRHGAGSLIPYIGKGRIDNTLYMIPDKGKLLDLCFCRQCGRCGTYCPSKAIRLSLDNAAFVQDIVRRISSFVDIT